MSEIDNKPVEEGKATPNVDTTKYVPKEDYEKLSSSKKEIEAKLDDAKMSLLDPSYIEFLESKKGRKFEAEVKSALSKVSDDDLERMSSKQLLALAVEEAKQAVGREMAVKYDDYLKKQSTTLSDVLAVLELQAVEKKYKDFDTYRDDTRKILETSKTPLTIEQAYKQAKLDTLVAEGKLEPKEAEAIKKVSSSEKPGSVPGGEIKPAEFKDKVSAAEDAWNKVVGAGKDIL